MEFIETILPGVIVSVITAILFGLWQFSKARWKKSRKLESDVVVVDQSVTLDEQGCYCLKLVLRNDGESSAVITGAKLLSEYKRKLEMPIQAISKVVSSATYDCVIAPDDGNEVYEIEICQQIQSKEVGSFSIRIDSSSNNWICIFKILLLVNEDSKELHSGRVGILFEDVFDGWGLDHPSTHDVKTRLDSCTTKSESAESLLARVDGRTNQIIPGWFIYIPEVTINAFELQGGSREDLIRSFVLRQSEPGIFLRVKGQEDPIEIAKCSFIKPNLVETVAHVVHNRRSGIRIVPSSLFVMARTGDDAGKLIQAKSYWLMPEPVDNQPIEGIAYIELVDSANNVGIPARSYEVPDFKTHFKQFS